MIISGEDANTMLVAILSGKPFSGPPEWKEVWDRITEQVNNRPDWAQVVDIPAEMPSPSPSTPTPTA